MMMIAPRGVKQHVCLLCLVDLIYMWHAGLQTEWQEAFMGCLKGCIVVNGKVLYYEDGGKKITSMCAQVDTFLMLGKVLIID